jgi:hypothetical protein
LRDTIANKDHALEEQKQIMNRLQYELEQAHDREKNANKYREALIRL